MELIPFRGSLKRYWRRQRYRRLHGSAKISRKNVIVARFGGNTPRRGWRIKVVRRLRLLRVGSPLKLWAKVKDAYMNMMVNLAGNVGYLNTSNNFGGKRVPKARQVPGVTYSTDEVESRLIFEIYKALQLQASRELSAT